MFTVTLKHLNLSLVNNVLNVQFLSLKTKHTVPKLLNGSDIYGLFLEPNFITRVQIS